MAQIDISSLILLGLAGLGIISGNSTVTIAMVILLLLRVTHLQSLFP